MFLINMFLICSGGVIMKWSEVIEKYGEEMAQKMADCKYMQCITCTMVDGVPDIPERDIIHAANFVMFGKEAWDWD